MDVLSGAIIIAGLKYVGPGAADVVKDFLGKVLSPVGTRLAQSLRIHCRSFSASEWREPISFWWTQRPSLSPEAKSQPPFQAESCGRCLKRARLRKMRSSGAYGHIC
jgi:hypothetical protein